MSAILHPGSGRLSGRIQHRTRVSDRGIGARVRSAASFSVLVAGLTFFLQQSFSFAGMLIIENSRRVAQAAEARATEAAKGTQDLRLELARMQRADSVDRWATVNGFVPSYAVEHETSRPD